ncbi:hypothetical protein CHU98_g12221 [Xylaria longipes]|nr:hypothetical protein CHU98_g12221 [Xylaria longipes]
MEDFFVEILCRGLCVGIIVAIDKFVVRRRDAIVQTVRRLQATLHIPPYLSVVSKTAPGITDESLRHGTEMAVLFGIGSLAIFAVLVIIGKAKSLWRLVAAIVIPVLSYTRSLVVRRPPSLPPAAVGATWTEYRRVMTGYLQGFLNGRKAGAREQRSGDDEFVMELVMALGPCVGCCAYGLILSCQPAVQDQEGSGNLSKTVLVDGESEMVVDLMRPYEIEVGKWFGSSATGVEVQWHQTG